MTKKQKDTQIQAQQTTIPEKKRKALTELTDDDLKQIHGGTRSTDKPSVSDISITKVFDTPSNS
ncbi:hypothetical protein [Dictyobacter formicarum]|uniref:Bacteriocin n=1 Tax=Dictyobacter formicarum TaxID=2778368 RepID=A0ABQ3V9J8_9CHLR|nr:hypothetical protein [Dictyobacter formicarum]GHO82519.1 hypothetical protein KSZ_05250 [Dictyobacter formicarum]